LTVIVVVFFVDPSATATVTFPVRLEVVVKPNVVLTVPTGSVALAGTTSPELLDDSASVVAVPEFESVTVQVPPEPDTTVAGLQLSDFNVGGANSESVVVTDTELRVAVIVAVTSEPMLPADALKVPVVEFAGTVTDRGTVRAARLSVSATVVLAEAGLDNVTVHDVLVLDTRLGALQVSEESTVADRRLMEAVCELAPKVAVTVAVWLVAMLVPAVAEKVAAVAPAATVTDAGTVNNELLLASVTEAPPVGALWLRVAVQVLTAPWPRLAGLHASVEIISGATRLMAAVCEPAPKLAVTVAL
jgi:hypothetical protein